MKTGIRIAGGLLPLVLLAAMILACENSMNVITPTDATMNIWANPANIFLDPNDPNAPRDDRGKLIGFTSIFAQMVDKNGYPLQNRSVVFSTDGGRLGSQPPPGAPPNELTTDANGLVHDSLTVAEDQGPTIKVTAQSFSLAKTVTVTRSVGSCLPAITAHAATTSTLPLPKPTGTNCSTAHLVGTAEQTTGTVTCLWTCGGTATGPTNASADGCDVDCCYTVTATASVTVTDSRSTCAAQASATIQITVATTASQ